MRHPRLSFAVGVLAIITGCSSPDYSVGPQQGLPLRRELLLDCELTTTECEMIQRGIDYLLNHANPMCRLAGSSAQERYDATSGAGFRNQPQVDGYDMGVIPDPYPSDGYTNVYPSFWAEDRGDIATGALIAHEEYHHVGSEEGMALSIQNQCLNPQP